LCVVFRRQWVPAPERYRGAALGGIPPPWLGTTALE